MKTCVLLVSARKRKSVARVVGLGLFVGVFSGCAGHKEFQKGYDRGAADAVKRQYWIQQNLQKAAAPSREPGRPSIYQLRVDPDPKADVKTVPYEIAVPIYE